MNSRLRRPAVALLATSLSLGALAVSPAATAAPTGSISGHLTTHGVPITEDVIVIAYSPDSDLSEEGRPDEDGDYVVEGLEPGDYVVTFQSGAGTYAYEAYNDVSDVDDAELVTVDEGGAVAGINADLALAGHIAGTVENEAGDPLVGGYVVAYSEVPAEGGGTTWKYGAGSAEVDELGNYDIGWLAEGTYRLEFSVDGYQDEYYEDAATIEEGTDVEVVEAETSDADAVLAEDATISGTVIGADDQPLPGTYVVVYSSGDLEQPAELVQADDDGFYQVDGLRADDYVVYFDYEDEASDTYLDEYYDNVGEAEDATVIELAAGEDELDVDAQLIEGEHDPVQAPQVMNVTAPVISGAPQVGSPLTSSPGTWTPTPSLVEYYWVADDELLQGGTSATYVPTPADLGKVITVYVNASAEGYDYGFSMAVASGPVAAAPVPPVVVAPPVVTTPPVVTPPVAPGAALASILKGLDIAGAPKVGSTVKITGLDTVFRTATPVTYTFQWYAGSAKIKKATKSKLKITSAMKGKKISVKVTATATGTKASKKLILGKAR